MLSKTQGNIIKKRGMIQDKHKILRQGKHEDEIALHEDEEAFEAVHRPLAAYIDFAGGYGCIPDRGDYTGKTTSNSTTRRSYDPRVQLCHRLRGA